MSKKEANTNKLKILMFLLFPLCVIIIALMLFVPAGTTDYWQGWLFMLTLFTPFLFVVAYFLKHDPRLLERRMRFKEKEAKQKTIIKIANLLSFIGFLIPGLDHRYGWSTVPTWLIIVSDITILLGYLLIFFVFKENSYTTRTVEVLKGQKVITTGPYSVIRHPMYVGIILMYLSMPIALGSYWAALIFFIPVITIIVARTLNEEKVLLKQLRGYKEYTKKVRYRIIPGIW
jgi:protein-S-isoprenylcysteine O-methyltransferase Ste14